MKQTYHATERQWSIGSRVHLEATMIKSDHGRLDVIMVSSTTSGQTARQTNGLHYFSKSHEKKTSSIVELHDKCIHVLFQCESLSLTRCSASRQWSTFIIGLAHEYIIKHAHPVARWGECWIAELTGNASPVRAASALAICSWLGLPAVGGSGRAKGKLTPVERGGPCPDMRAR